SLLSRARYVALLCVLTVLAACATDQREQDFTWIVRVPDRTDSDRSIDQRRNPEKLLEFYGVRPGMRVMDLSAGRGYNTELLARAVGPDGRVYAQNSPQILSGATKTAFEERLKKAPLGNTVAIVSEFDDPIPAEVRNLDLVTF